MKTGMLWFDNSGKTLEIKVREAATYYHRKYGIKPNLAYAPAGTQPTTVDGIRVVNDKTVLPHHLWIGVEGA